MKLSDNKVPILQNVYTLITCIPPVLKAYYPTICWRDVPYTVCTTGSDLDCGYQGDASSHTAGKSEITTMMKCNNKQRNCKTKHVADKTSWETWSSLVLFADCVYPQRAVCVPVTSGLHYIFKRNDSRWGKCWLVMNLANEMTTGIHFTLQSKDAYCCCTCSTMFVYFWALKISGFSHLPK